ncbi:MAG: pyridoxal phosphate-dependent aminotransferase [Candidatus Latescibacteria bacterium]|nr:pyridoxal phosphate-dependent aminotransferase [Candidatus Latescibacterota bacterium]
MSQSRRVEAIQSPVIPDVAALIRATPGTISLGQGVVHYGPPPQSFAAIAGFGGQPAEHHYRAAGGLPELQEQLRQKLARDNGIVLGDDQMLMVTAGSNMGFCHALMAIADPGDEIVLMSPFYFNHEMAVMMANCQPVLVPTDERYQLRLDAIEAALGPRTRAVVTISPNNPSGAVYAPEDLRAVNELCRQRGIYHLADEAYEYFTYGGARHFSPGSLPESAGHTISFFSFSKAYGMANWRVGYLVAPRHLLRALEKVQDTVLICPPVISQLAALGALEAGPDYCRPFTATLARVRQACLERLGELGERCQVPPAEGAFYLLARLQTAMPAMQLVERLVREYQVAVIPGTAFGLQEACHLRIAYGALQPDSVAQGMDRLVNGLQRLLD